MKCVCVCVRACASETHICCIEVTDTFDHARGQETLWGYVHPRSQNLESVEEIQINSAEALPACVCMCCVRCVLCGTQTSNTCSSPVGFPIPTSAMTALRISDEMGTSASGGGRVTLIVMTYQRYCWFGAVKVTLPVYWPPSAGDSVISYLLVSIRGTMIWASPERKARSDSTSYTVSSCWMLGTFNLIFSCSRARHSTCRANRTWGWGVRLMGQDAQSSKRLEAGVRVLPKQLLVVEKRLGAEGLAVTKQFVQVSHRAEPSRGWVADPCRFMVQGTPQNLNLAGETSLKQPLVSREGPKIPGLAARLASNPHPDIGKAPKSQPPWQDWPQTASPT